ncbi:unnamed protein product [Adineta steineri]|uniref:Uncharacterized protein n=2 Tax=Adineta steineri TaxID=433720 RepID=A0A815P3A6_9BILA|nr:unnamed protein product [Adineta steineri]CAF3546600.1 unnamed protein product [Adineta steineri]
MSVRSDVNTTAKLNKIANHVNSSHYDDKNMYHDLNLKTHQQQYTTYNTNNISNISLVSTTNYEAQQKKNSTNRTNTNDKKRINHLTKQKHRHYNNHYNYSNEYYQQQRSTNNKRSKRVGASIIQNQPQRKPIGNGSNNNNFGHHSISDNDQKESKEWE